MNRAGRTAALVAGLSAWLAPAAALGCPYCAGRSDGGVAGLVILGSFVFLPFAVAGVVYQYVKAGEDSSRSPL